MQRNLDPSGSDTEVPVVGYLTTLCLSLARSMIGGRKPITLSVRGSEGTATPDDAIALGLITTELVINSLKHAFPSGEGSVNVVYDATPTSWKLSIIDDGVGMASSSKTGEEGLGTSIVESLSKQLMACIDRKSSSSGTNVTIRYPRVMATAE